MGWVYIHLLKPILFRFTPDYTHRSMLKMSAHISRVSFLRKFVRLIFKRRPDKHLIQIIHGVKFTNPVGLSAGFDKNGETIPSIAALGFGFATVGSVTARECIGNPKPWFHRLPKSKSLIVYVGLANQGVKAVLARVKNYPADSIAHFPIVLSVAKTNVKEVVSVEEGIDDYLTSLKLARKEKNISLFEVNISCPNTYGGEPFTSPDRLEKLLLDIDKLGLEKPVFIKMPIDRPWKEFEQILDTAVKHKIDGVTIGNLLKDRKLAKLAEELPDTIKGNLSGKPTWQASNDLIKRTYQKYGDKLTIVGAGGVFSADDAYIKIRLGASLIDVVTGLIFKGPQLVAQINDGLIRLLKRDGFENISQAVGIDSGKKLSK